MRGAEVLRNIGLSVVKCWCYYYIVSVLASLLGIISREKALVEAFCQGRMREAGSSQ